MKVRDRVARIEEICGHHFDNKDLITSAITHPSAVEGQPVSASYERLEFLGDSIIGELIIFGESEKGTGSRGMHSALENVYEAVVGALYLDAGFEKTHAFVQRTLAPHVSPKLAERPISPKSLLQEVTQRDMRCAPEYKLEGEEGPAHKPTFVSVVLVDGKRQGRGEGPSKKESESAAALDALERLGYLSSDEGAPTQKG